MAHHSFLLSHYLHLVSHHFFFTIYSIFCPIPTPIHFLNSTPFFTPFTWFADGLTTSHHFSFHHRHSHRLLLSSHAHEIFLCVVHYTRRFGFDHWVFVPSFLLEAFGFSLLLGILMFDGFLSLETVLWWYSIHLFVVCQISTLGHIFHFLWGS